MRRRFAIATTTAALMVVPLSAASAEHTGCEPHDRTQRAHATVPHETDGNMTAHGSIPYCPPDDAPRHHQDGGAH